MAPAFARRRLWKRTLGVETGLEGDEIDAIASDFEYVEVMNMSTGPLAVGGASFENGIQFVFPSNLVLAGRQLSFSPQVSHAADGLTKTSEKPASRVIGYQSPS